MVHKYIFGEDIYGNGCFIVVLYWPAKLHALNCIRREKEEKEGGGGGAKGREKRRGGGGGFGEGTTCFFSGSS